MYSQTLFGRVFTLVSAVNPSRSLQIFFSSVLLAFSASTVNAQTFYTDWMATANPLIVNFTLPDGTTGTITKTNTVCETGTGNMGLSSVAHAGFPNYPSSFYTPTPPNPLEFVFNQTNRDGALCASPTAVVNNYVITLSETTANLRFHFINLDAGTWRFFNSAMTPINVTRLSGNTDFEVSGNAVNTTALAATVAGCDTVPNTADTGGCGTIFVPGKYTQLRVTTTDSEPGTGSGDSHQFTISISDDHGDAPASYDNFGVGEASHDLLALNLTIGATVDADAAEKSGIPATGDDTTGIDDEDGAAELFNVYQPAGGQTCTGTFGPYTTSANEYCTVVNVTRTGANAQLVGWLDADGDGDFTDAVDRSVPLPHPAVDDGTFTTPNIFFGTSFQAVLVWQGLPPILPATRYFRFRITRDATFFTAAPPPTGAAIDGEVEDYRVLAPTAANVSVSGRVVSPGGTAIRGVQLVLTDSLGNSLTAVSSTFGYFSFDDVEAGQIYLLTPSHRRYQFDTQVLTVDDTVTDLVIMPVKSP